ncbi:MAG: PhoU domain-containing protein [Candidatus Paceibacterales bacterium]
METRKIQSIGGSSFSLVLPKKWVISHKLKNKAQVRVSLLQSGHLVVWPANNKIIHRHKISIDGVEGEELVRDVIVLYILGFDEVELQAKIISSRQRKIVRETAQRLMGMETVEESSAHIYLRNFLDAEKFVFKEYLGKMFLMARLMFADAVNSFLHNNKELAADVVERDYEVDRIDFLISRMKHSLLLGKISEEQLKTGLLEASFYENIAKQLERIADHAVKISRLVETDKMPANKALDNALRAASETIILLLKEAEAFVKSPNKNLANKALKDIGALAPSSRLLYEELIKSHFVPALILSDSFDRIAGYIVNMAEYTLAQAMINAG